MSTEPLSVTREESTTARPLTTLSAVAFACAAVAPAESGNFTSLKARDLERMGDASALFESAPVPKPTALSRSEIEGVLLLATRASSSHLVAESWEEFEALDEEAAEMEVPPPNEGIKKIARRILMELASEFPRYYMVSPGEGSEVAIQASAGMGKGRGVLIVCDEDGVACFVTMNGESSRERYDHEAAKSLPNDFIRAAMRQLG